MNDTQTAYSAIRRADSQALPVVRVSEQQALALAAVQRLTAANIDLDGVAQIVLRLSTVVRDKIASGRGDLDAKMLDIGLQGLDEAVGALECAGSDSDRTCPACQGTGEGRHEGANCFLCRGRGEA